MAWIAVVWCVESYTSAMEDKDHGWRLTALALAWLCGVAAQLQERALMPWSSYAAIAAVGVICFALQRVWKPRGVFALTVLALALLGFSATGGRAWVHWNDRLPAALEGRDIQVTGVVASLPQRSSAGLRFSFDVEQALLDGQALKLPSNLSLGWYAGFHEDAVLSGPQRELGAGQRWRFTVRLRQPHGNLNPHGFDYELLLFEQGVGATGYVRDDVTLMLDASAAHPVERWRQRVRDAVEARIPDRRTAGVISALVVGDQSAIARDDWDLFRITGIAHLISISGLHVTMFAWVAGLLVAAAWRRSERLALWLPTPQAARWGGLIAALAYAVFSGWGVPSQRTVWMLATVTVLQTLSRRWPWPLVLLTAAVVVSAFDPWALLQPGFWLSFMAVGLLMSSSVADKDEAERAAKPPGWRGGMAALQGSMGQGLRTQVIATVGLTPLSVVFFQQVSVVGLLANLAAIPLVTLVITPLAMLGVLIAPLWTLAAWVVQVGVMGLSWLARFPVAVWTVPVAPMWAQAAGLLAAVLLVVPLPWRVRALALPLALPLLMPPSVLPPEGQFEMVAADVGQGTSVLVRTHNHLLVFDAGPQYSRDSDAGQRVLLPLLRSRGEARIDRLVLSHRDTDHVGGAPALLGGYAITDMLSSLEVGHPLHEQAALRKVPSQRCEAGQRWTWDGVRFAVLHPLPGDYDRKLRSNAMSCVIRVESSPINGKTHSVLLTGDIEKAEEASLLSLHGAALKTDVLIVPHHGSKTSSTSAFLDAVQPDVAVFQAGYRNRFGHPANEVVSRYRARNITEIDSPGCGAWSWQGQSEANAAVCQRQSNRRYWHHP
jgi:competence protein ComEC